VEAAQASRDATATALAGQVNADTATTGYVAEYEKEIARNGH